MREGATYDSNNPRHNSRHTALNHLVRAQDAGSHDPDAGFRGAVGGAEACEGYGGCAAEGGEEGLLGFMVSWWEIVDVVL